MTVASLSAFVRQELENAPCSASCRRSKPILISRDTATEKDGTPVDLDRETRPCTCYRARILAEID